MAPEVPASPQALVGGVTGPAQPAARDAALQGLAPLVAFGAAGFTVFLGVYATQPLLPLLGTVFTASQSVLALTVSAPTVAIALGSPFAGLVAQRFGHRAVISGALFLLIVPTFLAGTARTLPALIAWRFAQGLFVPGVYVGAIALITSEWRERVGRAMAIYITGGAIGSFTGRVVSGSVAEAFGWRASFFTLALLTACGALAVRASLPRAGSVPPRDDRGAASRSTLLDARLVTTCAVGFNILFTQVAIFTYVTFHLAAAPYRLGPAALGWIFVTYLLAATATPVLARGVDRFGSRHALVAALGLAVGGVALTLAAPLWAIIAGLTLCCVGAFISQSASTAYLQVAAPVRSRAVASGVYVSCYYLGGSAGAALPSAVWRVGGWPACVALVACVQVLTIATALRFWRGPGAEGKAIGQNVTVKGGRQP